MTRIIATSTAVPPHAIPQPKARQFALTHFRDSGLDLERLATVFDHAGIDTRYSCMPPEWFGNGRDFGESNAVYIDWATRLGEQVARHCLAQAELTPGDLDHIIFVSTTGLATPSIDARLANVLGLRSDIRRTPLWGLGCAGGASGLAHAYRAALADPTARVLLVAVELCSLTFKSDDYSKSNFVATALFADGAAGVLVAGDEATIDSDGPAITAASSTTWPDSLDVMGWNFDSVGMQVVFSRSIPKLVRDKARTNIEDFLNNNALTFDDLAAFIVHPGGPKVMEAYQEALPLPAAYFDGARAVLRDYGNMSSPTVLFVLDRCLRADTPNPGANALVTALGPGFSAENVLLQF